MGSKDASHRSHPRQRSVSGLIGTVVNMSLVWTGATALVTALVMYSALEAPATAVVLASGGGMTALVAASGVVFTRKRHACLVWSICLLACAIEVRGKPPPLLCIRPPTDPAVFPHQAAT